MRTPKRQLAKRAVGIAILAAMLSAALLLVMVMEQTQRNTAKAAAPALATEISGDGPNHPWYTESELQALHGQGGTKKMTVVVEEYDGDIWMYAQEPDRHGSWYRAMN